MTYIEKVLKELKNRFVWKHTPEGRGFLYDTAGEQTVDEVIFEDALTSTLHSFVAALKEAGEREKQKKTQAEELLDFAKVENIGSAVKSGYNMAIDRMISVAEGLLKDGADVSLCSSCNSMTKTVPSGIPDDGTNSSFTKMCGKCGDVK
jgi:hypothetical protein